MPQASQGTMLQPYTQKRQGLEPTSTLSLREEDQRNREAKLQDQKASLLLREGRTDDLPAGLERLRGKGREKHASTPPEGA